MTTGIASPSTSAVWPTCNSTVEPQALTSKDMVESVFEFNTYATGKEPGTFDAKRVAFYIGMQLEELAEVLRAVALGIVSAGERSTFENIPFAMDRLADEFKQGKHVGAIMRSDRAEVLDGFIDSAVVSLGGAMHMTPRFRQAIVEVLRANISKFPGGQVLRDPETGKVLKPAGWKAPDVGQYLDQPID